MRKIIFVHLLNDYSGSPKVLSQVIKVAQKEGKHIELYTSEGKGLLSNTTKNHHVYFYKRFNNRYLTLFSFMVSQLHLFLKLLRYRDEDILVYINTMLPFGAALAAKLMKKKVVYHIHETNLTPKLFKMFLRKIIENTSIKNIFVSEYVADAEGFNHIKEEVVYNALPQEFVKEAENYTYTVNDSFSVLMICSMKDYKGVKEFLAVANLCLVNKSTSFTLILNENQKEIDEFFEGMLIPSNVQVLTKKKDLMPYYKRSHLLLNLSRPDEWVETFGLTILEAMALGVPVIVPPVGGPVEIVEDGIQGYLISSYDVDKVADKVIFLAKNKNICLKLSQAAKLRTNSFQLEAFEKKIFKVFNDDL